MASLLLLAAAAANVFHSVGLEMGYIKYYLAPREEEKHETEINGEAQVMVVAEFILLNLINIHNFKSITGKNF